MFAGIGGICLGFRQTGAEIVWANEIDAFACITYRHNFSGDYLAEGDIRAIEPKNIPELDVLTAGFPCQSFSVMGNRKGFGDPRGTMFFEILRVIDAKRPQVVLLENVKNIIYHDKKKTIGTIVYSLAERGYCVTYSVTGANIHGNIPQYRDRVFIAAFKDYELYKKFEFPNEIRLTKSINDIVDRTQRKAPQYYYGADSRYYDALNRRATDTEAIYRIDDSGIAMKAWKACPTLKANMGTYRDRVPIVRDNFGIRKLTPTECLAFQGFPADYKLPDIPIEQVYKQIGNTVCVPVVERIAREIDLALG
jgi:DNA (cytosine-5)-methyltransferase 1